MKMIARLAGMIIPLLALSACLLTPGKFTSSLDVRKDGSFTFAYKGEVIAKDFADSMKGLGPNRSDNEEDAQEEDASFRQIASTSDDQEDGKTAKMQAIVDALMKEKGYRSARYVGGDTLEIDYEISGMLDHSFLFPFNADAQVILPFVAVEVRKDGKVRIQAPGFGEGDNKSGGMGGKGGMEQREGSFTLTTDARIVSQNQENGSTGTARGEKIVWQITPLTRIAPMAVLELTGSK
ncbi:MAG: hypothetical protein R3E04_13410 [Sphingobium sp.]